jgi:hypothetical protein
MTVDPVTMSAAMPANGPSPAQAPVGADGSAGGGSFPTTLANVQPAAARNAPASLAPAQPAREVSRFSLPGGGHRLGDQVLTQLGKVHQGDVGVRAPATPAGKAESVAAVLPQGPAAGPLNGAQAGKPEAPDGFQVQLTHLKEMYDQAVQVSLMTKSTGALNGTVNKLMSAQ